jgi:hypothetical protein
MTMLNLVVVVQTLVVEAVALETIGVHVHNKLVMVDPV